MTNVEEIESAPLLNNSSQMDEEFVHRIIMTTVGPVLQGAPEHSHAGLPNKNTDMHNVSSAHLNVEIANAISCISGRPCDQALLELLASERRAQQPSEDEQKNIERLFEVAGHIVSVRRRPIERSQEIVHVIRESEREVFVQFTFRQDKKHRDFPPSLIFYIGVPSHNAERGFLVGGTKFIGKDDLERYQQNSRAVYMYEVTIIESTNAVDMPPEELHKLLQQMNCEVEAVGPGRFRVRITGSTDGTYNGAKVVTLDKGGKTVSTRILALSKGEIFTEYVIQGPFNLHFPFVGEAKAHRIVFG